MQSSQHKSATISPQKVMMVFGKRAFFYHALSEYLIRSHNFTN